MEKLQHNRPCGFANLQKRRHHTVCHLRITGFDLMFQNRAGFFSHQIFGLTDVGKEIGTLGFYQRFIEGHQGDILRNPEVHCGKQAVEIGAGSGFCCNKGSDALLPDQLHHLLLIVNVGLMLVEGIPDRNGGFRNIACLRFLQNAVDTGANREGIPPGRRDEADIEAIDEDGEAVAVESSWDEETKTLLVSYQSVSKEVCVTGKWA